MSTPENVRLREEAAARRTAKIKKESTQKQANLCRITNIYEAINSSS